MEAVVAPSVIALLGDTLVSHDDARVPTVTALASAALVGVYFADDTLQACKDTTSALREVFDAVNATAPAGSRLEIVYVSQDDTEDSMRAAFAEMPWARLPWGSDRDSGMRSAFGLTAAILPELLFLDTRTGDVLVTDGRAALARGALTAPSFPAWRSDCFVPRMEPPRSLGGHDRAWLHPDSLLKAGLYAGDAIEVRFPKQGHKRVMYANAPMPGDAPAPEPPRSAILLPEPESSDVYVDAARREAFVVVQLAEEPEELPVVVLAPRDDLTADTVAPRSPRSSVVAAGSPDHSAAASAVAEYFGTAGHAKAAALADALTTPGTGGGASSSTVSADSWLSSYVVSSECQRRIVQGGDTLCVGRFVFSVEISRGAGSGTGPQRGVVGPTTDLRVQWPADPGTP